MGSTKASKVTKKKVSKKKKVTKKVTPKYATREEGRAMSIKGEL